MENKLRSVLSGTGFYVLLAVCLIVAAVSGWFLLFGTDSAPEEEAPPPAAVSAPARDVYVPEPEDTGGPEDEPSAEVSAPAPVEVEIVPAMPEVPVDDTPVIAQEPRLVVEPLKGEVLMAFSVDQLVYSPTLADWRTHDGVDISAAPGSTVLAATSGTVASVEDDPMMGTTVTIDHEGGYTTVYANLQAKPTVLPGDLVTAGQIIGAVGSTAAAEAAQSPHLHFSVTQDGEAVDPSEFLGR
ncbi:M23 family metallopeptidase [uncultured Oscillibacter sp.]|uniref:M23 family metallopeptidase n=1 Tax=uncultured Oscillibacter sp. TaxID=876091 RepID=UPI0025F62F99|nr:M23 family metallopeptidase [uncultured Oscillibacter sp.]